MQGVKPLGNSWEREANKFKSKKKNDGCFPFLALTILGKGHILCVARERRVECAQGKKKVKLLECSVTCDTPGASSLWTHMLASARSESFSI